MEVIERGLWIGHGRLERRSDAVGEMLGRRGKRGVVSLVFRHLDSECGAITIHPADASAAMRRKGLFDL
jgi:hypothetical protein